MILMYHKVDLHSPTMWWVSVNNFYRQMIEISNKKIVYLDDYNPNDDSHVVITFDGIYENVLKYALPILKYFDYPFELFFTSDYLGRDNSFDHVEPIAHFVTKEQLIQLVKGGGRLQWHTKSHLNLKHVLDEAVILEELKVSEDIKNLDSKGFKWFAYPHGEFNEIVLKHVKNLFNGAVSCIQGSNTDSFRYNRLTVTNSTKLSENSVACIIASYNYGSFLVEAIESVLKQSILPDEILITDDSSDDDTQIIAESYVKKYPDLIKYNRNHKNLGIVNNFNKAISLTTSNYVFFLGADNRLLSNYVEECVQVLNSDDSVQIAYTDYAFFGSRAKLKYANFKEEWRGGVVFDTYYKINFPSFNNHDELFNELQKNNFIHGSSMYKRVVFDEVGGYVETNNAEDYNLFKRIIENGGMAKKAIKTNLEYRQHSPSQANNIVELYNSLRFYKNLSEDLVKEVKRRSNFQKSILYRASYFLYKILKVLKKNYKDPLKIFRHIRNVTMRLFRGKKRLDK